MRSDWQSLGCPAPWLGPSLGRDSPMGLCLLAPWRQLEGGVCVQASSPSRPIPSTCGREEGQEEGLTARVSDPAGR